MDKKHKIPTWIIKADTKEGENHGFIRQFSPSFLETKKIDGNSM